MHENNCSAQLDHSRQLWRTTCGCGQERVSLSAGQRGQWWGKANILARLPRRSQAAILPLLILPRADYCQAFWEEASILPPWARDTAPCRSQHWPWCDQRSRFSSLMLCAASLVFRSLLFFESGRSWPNQLGWGAWKIEMETRVVFV